MLDLTQNSRDAAEARFHALTFPSPKEENYRFTPLEFRARAEAPGRALPASLTKMEDGEGALLMFEGDQLRSLGRAPNAAFFDFRAAEASLPEGEEVSFPEDKFAQQTLARWINGAYVRVPAGVKLAQPVRFVLCPRAGETHYRNRIELGEGAEAVVVQECWSDEAARFVGELTEVRLAKNARLHWITLQQLGAGVEAMLRQHVRLEEGAELRHTPLHLGGRLVQVRQETHLAGEGASIDTQGAARGDGQQHFDFWLDARHEASRTRSAMDYWFVMAEKSRGVFNGLIEVQRQALDCESAQRAKSLLLGHGAVHSIPKLIIKTDAVKAAHGASIASVSPEQLHYLESRGIPRGEAEAMIVRGFTQLVVERLPLDSLRARADSLLDGKKGGGHD